MLRKSTLREIMTSLARYLAIFSIVALGVGFFSGLKDCRESMEYTAREYMEKYNFYDYQIMTSYGIDDDSVKRAEAWDGVTDAEGSVQIDVLAETGDADSFALKTLSLPEKINTLRVVEGRLPEKNNECAVDNYSVGDGEYKIGDVIRLSEGNDKDTLEKFKEREFKVVGKVNTPIYLDYQRGSTDIGNGSLESFFYIPKDAYDVDYFTQLYLTLEGDERPFTEELETKLEGAETSMEELAEDINDARREKARKEAQDELEDKKKEYQEKLDEYETERADALEEIAKGRRDIKKGRAAIKSKRSELKSTIAKLEGIIDGAPAKEKEIDAGIEKGEKIIKGLKTDKSDIEKGMAEAEANKKELKQAYDAGMIDAATYKAGVAKADATIKDLKKNLAQVNGGISEAQNEINTGKAGKNQLKSGVAEAKEGLKQAKAGLGTLNSKESQLNSAERTLNSKEAEAYEEFAKAEKKLDDAKDKIDDAQKKIDEMETGNSYALSGLDNTGYSSFDSNSSIVDNIAKLFPIFFLLIAGLVCMTTMTRMIDEQRTQIGILKALGYSNAQIAGKYLFYSGSAAFLGALLGFFVGCKVFPAVIWNAYTMMYDFSDTVEYVLNPVLGSMSIGAALLCSMGATWLSLRQDFKVSPSDLIRPKTPPAGKRILMERITPLWKRISFLYKVSIRNIFRDKKRFLMMVLGVSGCTALLIAGMGIKTTIADVADYQFDEISLYDFSVIFNKNMNEKRQAEFTKHMSEKSVGANDIMFLHQAELTLEAGSAKEDLTCHAVTNKDFSRFVNLHRKGDKIEFPGDGEIVIVSKLHHDYGLDVGDEVTLRDGFREMKATVSGVADNYVFDSIYMSEETYEKGFGVKPEIKAAMIIVPAAADNKTDVVGVDKNEDDAGESDGDAAESDSDGAAGVDKNEDAAGESDGDAAESDSDDAAGADKKADDAAESDGDAAESDSEGAAGIDKKDDSAGIGTAFINDGEKADEEAIRAAATQAANYDEAAAVSVNIDMRDSVSRMMKSLDAVVYVVILSAALLAFIVLYNLTNINITERIREIATIKVLGFYHLETALYVFRENFFLTAVAAVVGIPLGKWLLKFVIDNIVIKMIFFEPRLTRWDIALSVVLTFVFAFFVNLTMQRRLANVSMTESLKSVE